MCLEIDWWTILCVGGVKVRVDCGDLAVVRVEDGVFEQKAERRHFWDEYVAGAIELCLKSILDGVDDAVSKRTKANMKLVIFQAVNGHIPRQ